MDPDRIITAKLQGTASRHAASWKRPEGEERAAAIAELKEIATVTPKARRGSVHQPKPALRTDLLAEVAGTRLGSAGETFAKQRRIEADLLIDAGADPAEVEKWIPIGRERAERAGPAFSRAKPMHWSKPPEQSQ